MATSYPGGLDSFSNPTSTDGQNSPSHSAQHANANDAIEAIEAELGTSPSDTYSTVGAYLADTVKRSANSDNIFTTPQSSFLTTYIRHDGSSTGTWPDKFVFYMETAQGSGVYVKTGGTNEFGELRARPRNDTSTAFRAFSAISGASKASTYFFQLARGSDEHMLLGANETGIDSEIPLRAPNTWQRAMFGVTGALTTRTGASRWYNRTGVTLTIQKVEIQVPTTGPTGADLIVDVNKNGTTVYSTQANRPKVTAGTSAPTANVATAPDVTTVADGDYLTVDIDQVGSSVAGTDLLVTVWLV